VHKLSTRDWLLARITKVEERVVDLSKSLNGVHPDRRSIGDMSDGASLDDENPFELSDGLRWYLLDAIEEKPGAPSTPGLGKSTVASANVDAKGSIRLKRASTAGNVTKTLTRSLDSRRSSSNSKKGTPIPALHASESIGDQVQPAEVDAGLPSREAAPIFDEVRRDLLRRS
jgi:autophagy-related protein 11